MNPEWLTAHLDGELDLSEAAQVEDALARDAELAATYEGLADVRARLRAATIDVPPGAVDEIVARVASVADQEASVPATGAPVVVPLTRRRRVRLLTAVAAAFVIIAGVVLGVGSTASLPAIGELVERHEAAAAMIDGTAGAVDELVDEEMPMGVDDLMDDEMPMDEAMDDAPPMPGDYAMRYAFRSGPTVQLVYETGEGVPVSVFRHEGEADVADFADGEVRSGPAGDMWSGSVDELGVLVVDGEGYVWVVVMRSGPDDMMDDMMDELPTRDLSLIERLRRAVDGLRFWD